MTRKDFQPLKSFTPSALISLPVFSIQRKSCVNWPMSGTNTEAAFITCTVQQATVILLGINTENVQPCFDALSEIGFDLGGSGGAMRTISCCVGQARCEKACIDSMNVAYDLTMKYQDVIHRPQWPYKFKIKVAACSNDCVAASARSDLAIIGTWRDTLKIDQAGVRDYVAKGLEYRRTSHSQMPDSALEWDTE